MVASIMDSYSYQFSHMRTDTNRKRWTLATMHRAPHKPFLLLSILDLFTQGSLQSNFIEMTPELGSLFSKYWSILMPVVRRGNIALPFFHMRSSSFWHLIPVPGKAALLNAARQVDSFTQLQKLILGAKLDDELFELLKVEYSRNTLRKILFKTYFAPEYHEALHQQSTVNLQSYSYSQELVEKAKKQAREASGSGDHYQANVRDQGFRRAVVSLYDHRCAFCGVRMLTADGHSVVDAAHIIPWSISHNDNPRNGMALCRLCHWTFDEGLAAVSTKYTVLLSAELRTLMNVPGHLLTLESRPIISPTEHFFMPDMESLSWHRQNTFRR